MVVKWLGSGHAGQVEPFYAEFALVSSHSPKTCLGFTSNGYSKLQIDYSKLPIVVNVRENGSLSLC